MAKIITSNQKIVSARISVNLFLLLLFIYLLDKQSLHAKIKKSHKLQTARKVRSLNLKKLHWF